MGNPASQYRDQFRLSAQLQMQVEQHDQADADPDVEDEVDTAADAEPASASCVPCSGIQGRNRSRRWQRTRSGGRPRANAGTRSRHRAGSWPAEPIGQVAHHDSQRTGRAGYAWRRGRLPWPANRRCTRIVRLLDVVQSAGSDLAQAFRRMRHSVLPEPARGGAFRAHGAQAIVGVGQLQARGQAREGGGLQHQAAQGGGRLGALREIGRRARNRRGRARARR